MKKKSILDKIFGRQKEESSGEAREFVAEQLESRILYSAAPVEAAPEGEQTAPDAASDGGFEEISDFGGAAEVGAHSTDASLEEYVTLSSFENLTDEELAALADVAVQRWIDSGISDEQIAALRSIEYEIVDLEGEILGSADGYEIEIDINAAGEGWFVDATPFQDEEFGIIDSLTALRSGDPEEFGMDLLTVLMHEQGHVLGLEDLDASQWDNVMYSFLGEGERRLIGEGLAEAAQAGSLEGSHNLTAVDDSVTVDANVVTSIDADNGLLANDTATGTLDPTAGEDFAVDASTDVDGDNRAEDPNSAYELLLDTANGVARVDVTSSFRGITGAYNFPGGFANDNASAVSNLGGALLVADGATAQLSFQELPGDWSNENVTIEIWVKPNNLTPTPANGQIIFEDGGGTGLGFFVDDNEIRMRKAPGGGNVAYNISTDPSGLLKGAATAEFIQVTGTYNVASGVMEMFINGTSVGSATPGGSDWSGGDAAGFGSGGDANVGGVGGNQSSTESLDGQIAKVRVYRDQILTSTEVQANFDSVAQPLLEVTEINGLAANVGASIALTHGSVVVQSDGSLVYTPTSGSNGDTESFTYTVRDNTDLTTDTRNVTLNLVANTAPTPTADTASVSENATVLIDVLANDTDPDTGNNSGLFISAFDSVSVNGGIVSLESGQLRYDPNGQFENLDAGANATDTFVYTVSDGILTTDATVTVTITGENDAPTSNAAEVYAIEDTEFTFSLSDFPFADVDAIPAPDTIQAVRIDTLPSGTLTFEGNPVTAGLVISAADLSAGKLKYQAAQDDFGLRHTSFNFSVSDGTAFAASPSTMTIHVQPRVDGITVVNDTLSVGEDDTVATNVAAPGPLANDTVPANEANPTTGLPTAIVTTSLTLNYDAENETVGDAGASTWEPNPLPAANGGADPNTDHNYDGLNLIAITDNNTRSDITRAYTFDGSTVATNIGLNDLLNNPADGDASWEIWFRPDENGSGTRDILFESGGGGTGMLVTYNRSSGEVELTIDDDNVQLMVAGGAGLVTSTDFHQLVATYNRNESGGVDAIRVYLDGALVGVAQTSDILDTWDGGDSAALGGSSGSTGEGVSGATNFEGEIAKFRFYEKTLTEAEVNQNYHVSAPITFDTTGVVGTLVTNPDGSYSYDPNGQFEFLGNGETAIETFSYTITDATGAHTGTVEITINGANDDPVATDDSFDVASGAGATVLGNVILGGGSNAADSDTDADPLTVVSYEDGSGPVSAGNQLATQAGGLVTISSFGEITYDGSGVSGSPGSTVIDQFTYTINDDGSPTGTATATVTVNVVIANPPAAGDDSYTTNEDAILVRTAADADDLLNNDEAGTTVDIANSDSVSLNGASISYTGAGNVGDGGFTYDPTGSALFQSLAAGEQLVDTFTYQILSGSGVPNTATVTVTVDGQGAIEINTNLSMPVTFTGANAPGTDGTSDTVSITESGGNLDILINGETLRSVPLGSLGGPTDIIITGSGDQDTIDIGALSHANIGTLTIDPGAGIDTVNINGALDIGGLVVSGETINLFGDVTTSGDQIYNDGVILGTDVTVTAANATFASTIDSDSDSTKRDFTLNLSGAGTALLNGDIGSTAQLDQLTTGSNGTVVFGSYVANLVSDNLLFNWDATLDTNNDNFWDSTVNPANETRIDFTGSAGITPDNVVDATFGGITKAFTFGGAGMAAGATSGSWDSGFSNLANSRLDARDSSLEFVIRPDDFTGNHVIWESGGTGVGAVLTLEEVTGSADPNDDGAYLRLEVRSGSDIVVEQQLSGVNGLGIAAGEWMQVVTQFDLTADKMRLIVNGTVSEVDFTPNDWSGTGGAGIANESGATPATDTADATNGGTGATGPGFSPTVFNGQIAAIRHYDSILSAGEISQNFTYLQTTQTVGNLAVNAAGAVTFGNNLEVVKGVDLSGGDTVVLNGTLDDDNDGGTVANVSITSVGNTTFNDAVGASSAVDSLTVTAPVIHVHGGGVTTGLAQVYNGTVHTIAGSPTAYTSTAGNITINGDFTQLSNTVVNTADLTVTGTTTISNSATFDVVASDIVTFADLNITGATNIDADNDAIFGGVVTGTGATLTLNVSDLARFDSTVDVNAIVANEQTNPGNAGRIEFRDDVTLRGTGGTDTVLNQQVVIGEDLTISADAGGDGDLVFGISLDSDNGGNRNLTISANGGSNVEFRGSVGGDLETNDSNPNGFGNLTIDGTGNLIINDQNFGSLPGFDEKPYLNYVAWADSDTSDTNWENTSLYRGTAHTMTLAAAGTFNANPVTNRGGINGSYSTTATGPSIETTPDNLSDESNSVEIWFKDTDNFTGDKILWETGGTSGSSLTLQGSLLTLSVRENSTIGNSPATGAIIQFDMATLSAEEQADFNQVVMVYSRGSSTTAADDSISLYINGSQVGATVSANIDDNAGGDGMGLGVTSGITGGYPFEDNTQPATLEAFDGEYAIMRVWRQALNAGQVGQAFDIVNNPMAINATGTISIATAGTNLDSNVKIASSGGDVLISSTVDGENRLEVAGTNVSITGAIGGTTALDDFDATGTNAINLGSTIAVQGDSDSTFTGSVNLTADGGVNHTGAGDIVFAGTVDSATAQNLITSTIAGQHTIFQENVGATGALGSITAEGVEFGLASPISVTTTGTQTYNGSSVLIQNTTLIGATIELNSDLEGSTAGTESLTITGNLAIDGSVGSTTSLESVSVSGTTTLNGDSSFATANGTTLLGDVDSPDSSPEILSVDGDLILGDGTNAMTFNVDIGPGGTVFDSIDSNSGDVIINANVNLGANMFTGFTPSGNMVVTVIDKAAGGGITGTFANASEAGTLVIDGDNFDVTYLGGDGNDLVLTRAVTFEAGDDAALASEDTVLDSTISADADTVLANDAGAVDIIEVSGVTTDTAGIFTANSALGAIINLDRATGHFTYDPTTSIALQALAAGEQIVDTFTYKISDGSGGESEATVAVVVNGQGAVEINTAHRMPDGSIPGGDSGAETIAVSTVDVGGSQEIQVVVNGVAVRDAANITSHAAAPDVSISGSSDADSLSLDLSQKSLNSLTVAGSIETTTINSDITTAADQTFGAAVILGADVVLTGVNHNFQTTVDSDGTPRALTVNGTGTAKFTGDVGSGSALASVETDAGGQVEFGTGGATLQGTIVLNLDAGLDPNPGDNIAPNFGSADEFGVLDSGLSVAAVTGSSIAGLSSAYVFPGGSGVNGTAAIQLANAGDAFANLGDLGGNIDQNQVTFEAWIRPNAASFGSVNQSIYETGGGSGSGIALNGNELQFRTIGTGGSLQLAYDLSSDSSNLNALGGNAIGTEFFQVVATFDVGTQEGVLYVNGTEVARATTSGATDIDGGDGMAIGGIGEANMGGYGGGQSGFQSFHGEYAAFRVYEGVLDQATIQANRAFVANAAPTTVSVTTTGAQTFGNDVKLGLAATLTGTDVTFDGAIDDDGVASTVGTLTVNSSGTTTFNGAIGATERFSGLATDAAGTTVINTAQVDVDGGVLFEDNITTNQSTTFNTGSLSFSGSSDFTGTTVTNATVTNFTGAATFDGPVDVNGTAVTFASPVQFNDVADVEGTLSVDFNDIVNLGGNTTIASNGPATFANTVTGAAADTLTLNVNGTTSLSEVNVGVINSNLAGRLDLGGDVTLTGATDTTFGEKILLQSNVNITTSGAGDVVFNNTIDSADGANHDLTLTLTQGNALLNGDVGLDGLGGLSDNAGLGNLIVNGAGQLLIGTKVTGGASVATPYARWDAHSAPTGTNTQGTGHNLNVGANVTINSAPSSQYPNIASSWVLPGGAGAANILTASGSFDTISGDLSNEDVSVEIWFKPDSLSGGQLLWESGGTGTGSSLSITDGVLTLASNDGTAVTDLARVDFDLSTLPAAEQGDFIQVIAVYNVNTTGGGAVNDSITMFVNGVNRGSASFSSNDWIGSDATGLGGANATVGGSDDNDLDAASVTIADVVIAEDGTTATFTATLDNDVLGGFTVDAAVGAARDSATGGGTDYTFNAQTLAFNGIAGETRTFTVDINDDGDAEIPEEFTVSLTNLQGTGIAVDISDTAQGTITDNDGFSAPRISVDNVEVDETAGTMTFTATLDQAVANAFTVDITADAGTATDADIDETLPFTSTLNFAGTAGETQTFVLNVTDDADVESLREQLSISLGNLVGITGIDISDTAEGTIVDDNYVSDSDPAPALPTASFSGEIASMLVYREALNNTDAAAAFAGGSAALTINTIGDQSYNTAVTSEGNVFQGNDITFASTLDSSDASTKADITINTSGGGVTAFDAAVGGNNELGSLTTNSDGRTEIGATITANSDEGILFSDAVLLDGNTTITENGTGDVTFAGTVDSAAGNNFDLTVTTPGGGETVFLADVGSDALAALSDDAGLGNVTTDAVRIGGFGLPTAGSVANFEASTDDGGNSFWENTSSVTPGVNNLELDPAVTFVAVGATSTGITGAYQFPGGVAADTSPNTGTRLGAQFNNNLSSFSGGSGGTVDATFEVWFKPDTLTGGNQFLVETGGGTGIGFYVQNNNLHLFQTGSGADLQSDLTGLDSEFIQAVATVDIGGDTVLYINGQEVARGAATADWDGGDFAAIGTKGGDNAGGLGGGNQNRVPFDGQVAVYRQYNGTALSAAEVFANYQALTGLPVNITTTADQTYNGAVTVGGDSTLTAEDINFTSTTDLKDKDLTINVSGTDSVAAGVISGTGTLTKQGGAGTLSLNAVNTYTGDTTISAGVLDGTGTITGDVTVDTTGRLGSGDGGVGELTIGTAGNNSVVTVNGELEFTINGLSTPGTDFDQLNVVGSIALGANSSLVTNGTVGANNSDIVLIDNDTAGDAVTGTFNGLAEGDEVIVNSQSFLISYVGGDGNDVVLLANNNQAPEITGGPTATANFAENTAITTEVINLATTDDSDSEGSGLTYSFSTNSGGGVDNSLFAIDANTGALTFLASPDFETPGDDGSDNVYDVQVTVTDSGGLTDFQDIAVTVTNVDANLSIADATAQNEGNSGTVNFTFTVTRTGDTTGESSASYTISGTGSNPADASDFSSSLTGTVTFANSETTQDITVSVQGDTVVEFDEGFQVVLFSPVSAVIATDTATSTIINDDDRAAPEGSDNTLTIDQDATLTFTSADFGFSDPGDTPPDDFVGVIISTLPTSGTINLNGVAVNAGEFVAISDIDAGLLTFDPVAGESGAAYADFTFQVVDDGLGAPIAGISAITAVTTVEGFVSGEGGSQTLTSITDASGTYSDLTFVTGVSIAAPNTSSILHGTGTSTPATGNDAITDDRLDTGVLNPNESTNYLFGGTPGSTDRVFVISNHDGATAIQAVDGSGNLIGSVVTVSGVNDSLGAFDFERGGTAADLNDREIGGFTVEVREFDVDPSLIAGVRLISTGGDYNLIGFASPATGQNTDQSPNTITIDVTPAKVAPEGTDNTVTGDEDNTLVFTAADFGFSDPGETPPDNFAGVIISTLPVTGVLNLDGVAVEAGDFITIADINANKLTFDPVAGESGTAYADFTFQVVDDGFGTTPTDGVVAITDITSAEGFNTSGLNAGSHTLTSFTDAGGTYSNLRFVTSLSQAAPGGASILHGDGTTAPTSGTEAMTDDRLDTGVLNPGSATVYQFSDPLTNNDKFFVFVNNISDLPTAIQAHDGSGLIGQAVSISGAVGSLGTFNFERNDGQQPNLSPRSFGGFAIDVSDFGIADASLIQGVQFTGNNQQDFNLIGFASAPNGENTDQTPNTMTIDIRPTLEVSISANQPNAAEPDTDGQFTVTLNRVASQDIVVSYVVTGDATAGSDYTALTGEVTISAGQTSALIDVEVLGDSLVESSETVVITITGVTGAPSTDTVSFQDGVSPDITYSSNVNFLRESNPDDVNGGDANDNRLLLGGQGATARFNVVMEFDVSALTGLSDGMEISLPLQGAYSGSGFEISVYEYDFDLDTANATWNDPSGLGTDTTVGGTEGKLLTTFSVGTSATGAITIPTSSGLNGAVNNALASDGVLRLLLKGDGSAEFLRLQGNGSGVAATSRPGITITESVAEIGTSNQATVNIADGPVPTDVIYVDAAWVDEATFLSDGDADDGATGVQSAQFGTNAFQTIAEALAAVDPGGTVIVNGGTYGEDVSLTGTVTLEITGPDVGEAVTIQSLQTVAGTTVAIEGSASLTVGDASDREIAGLITGSGDLTKAGTGTLTISGANDYIGSTTVIAGEILVGNSTALGTSAGGTTVANNATLILADGITVSGEAVTINGAGDNFGGALRVENAGNAEWAGDVILGATPRIGADDGGNLTISGVIQNGGSSNLVISAAPAGSGTVTLSGANTYTGSTSITRGTLALGADDALPTGTDLIIDNSAGADDAILDLNGFDQEVASLSRLNDSGTGSSEVINSAATSNTLTVSGDMAYNGTLQLGVDGTNDSADLIAVTGNLDITNTVLDLSAVDSAPDDASYTLLTYTGTLTGAAFANVIGLPAGYELDFSTSGQINLVESAVNVSPSNVSVTFADDHIDENLTGTLNGSFTAGTNPVNTVFVDWGDGTIESEVLASGATTFSLDHQYLDDGDYDVNVIVRGGSYYDGLVGFWNFDDGTAVDHSGAGNDGSGGTISSGDTPFGTGQALSDGSVTVTNSASLEGLDDQVTIAYWSKTDPSTPDWSRTIVKQGGGEGWHIGRYAGTDDVNIRMDTTGQFNNNILWSQPDGTFDNGWHHVVFTFDNGVATQYVDGAFHQTQNYNHGDGLGNTGNLVIGSANLVGSIDEVGLWNRVLDPSEIAALGNAANGPLDTAAATASTSINVNDVAPVIDAIQVVSRDASTGDMTIQVDFSDAGTQDQHKAIIDWGDGSTPTEILITTGLRTLQSSHTYTNPQTHEISVTILDQLGDEIAGLWTFDDANLGVDSSGNTNNGAVGTGVTADTDTPDQLGSGASFSGTGVGGSNGIITVSSSASLEEVDDEMTIGFWINADAADNDAWFRIIRKGNEANDGTATWMVNRDGSTSEIGVRTDTFGTGGVHNNNSHRGTGDDVLDGEWHHVTYVFEGTPGSSGTVKEYIDGVLNATTTYAHGDGLSNMDDLLIGGRGNSNIVGNLDDLVIYSRALSDDEVFSIAGNAVSDALNARDTDTLSVTFGTLVYVNDDWTQQSDIVNNDGDIETAAVETATFGVDAFGNLSDAIAALNTTEPVTLIINAGDYSAEALDLSGLSNNVTVKFVEGDSTVGSLSGGSNVSVHLDDDVDHTFATNLTVGDANDTTFAGVISGNGSLTKEGAGSLTLSGVNTYLGTTDVNAGNLVVDGEIGNGGPAGTVSIANGATLSGGGTVLAQISGASGSTIEATGDLTLGDPGSNAFATNGDLIVGSHTVTLHDSGLATLGSLTTIDGGTLVAANGLSHSGGETLSGHGTIQGNIDMNSATLTVGDAADNTGTLTIEGNFTSNGDINLEVDGVVAGDFDQIVVEGNVDLTNANINTSSTVLATNGTVSLITNDLADSITTTGVTPAEGSLVSINGQFFVITYTGGDGNDVDLAVAAPAPVATSITRLTPADENTNADSLVFRVTFDSDVQNVDISDFVVNGATTATVTSVTPGTGSVYDVTVSGGDLATFNGPVGLNFASGQDIASTGTGNTPFAGVEPATDDTFTVDNIAPTPTITGPGAISTSNPFSVTVDFGEEVSGFTTGDVSVSGGSVTGFVDNNDGTFTLEITASGDGDVTVDVAGGTADDLAGNTTAAAPQMATEVDAVAPVPSVSGPATVAEGGTATVTVNFGEEVTGFDPSSPGDFPVTNGTVQGWTDNGGGSYTVQVRPDGTDPVVIGVAGGAAVSNTGINRASAASGAPLTMTVNEGGLNNEQLVGITSLFNTLAEERLFGNKPTVTVDIIDSSGEVVFGNVPIVPGGTRYITDSGSLFSDYRLYEVILRVGESDEPSDILTIVADTVNGTNLEPYLSLIGDVLNMVVSRL